MKTIYLILISLMIAPICKGQHWEVLDSLTPFHLNDVFFTSDQSGIAVGENGRILTTSDQGATWVVQNKIPGCNLLGVHFTDANTGWISGSCGIHHTTDGGATWNLQLPANGTTYNDVFFYDGQNGGATGTLMQIVTTHDGGANWAHSTLSVPETTNPLLAIHFANADTAWAGGGTKLHRTDDGGANWALNQSFNTVDWIHSMDFDPSGRAGVAVGVAGLTLYTYDHSANWNVGGFITPNHQNVNGVKMLGTDTVFAVCDDGLIYFSETGGSSWNSQVSPTTKDLNAVHFPSSKVGFAIGDNGALLRYGGINSLANTEKVETQIKVYPNPATDFLTITFSGSFDLSPQFHLIDVQGKVLDIASMEVDATSGQVGLNLQGISAGLYTLEVTQGEEILHHRLVISPR